MIFDEDIWVKLELDFIQIYRKMSVFTDEFKLFET